MTRSGFYFGAGPAALPTSVVEQAASEFVDFKNLGIGLGEMSHRSPQATEIIDSARSKVRELLKVPDTHEVLFVQGGGTGGFAAVLYAMVSYWLKSTGSAKAVGNYFVTGTWSSKALSEAERLGIDSHVVATGKNTEGTKYVRVPSPNEYKHNFSAKPAFVYYCDNETVHGIEFPENLPEVPDGTNLVCDISSNMLSRPIDVSRYAILFGGAQKNVGIPGVSLYIVRKDVLENQATPAELRAAGLPVAPSFLDLSLVAKNNSAFNTVSIFAIECINLVCKRLIERGGLDRQVKEAGEKAAKLYAVIDSRPDLFVTDVEHGSRSRMNIVFKLPSAEIESKLLKEAANHNLSGIKGHRSVGGIRISNYNAITPEAVDEACKVLTGFLA